MSLPRFPNHPTGHHLLGSLLMDVGRWSEAVDALRKSKSRHALAPITRYKLTVSLWSAGRISEAEREIDEATALVNPQLHLANQGQAAGDDRPAQAALAIVNDAVEPAQRYDR